MELWLVAVVQWLHVLFAIFWFGSVLTIDFLVIPTALSLPPTVGQSFGSAFGQRVPKVVTPIGITTILLGIVRGIVGGVLGRLDTAYGVTWIAAFVLATGLLVYGLRILTPAADRLRQLSGAEFEIAVARIKRLSQAELGGFLVVLVLMIAMRFGY